MMVDFIQIFSYINSGQFQDSSSQACLWNIFPNTATSLHNLQGWEWGKGDSQQWRMKIINLLLPPIRDENKWRKRQEYLERKFLFWRSISPPSQRVFPSPRLRWGKTREVYCEAPPLMRRWEVSLSPPPGNRSTDPSRRRWNIQQQHIFSNLNSLWPVKFWLNLTLRHFIFI